MKKLHLVWLIVVGAVACGSDLSAVDAAVPYSTTDLHAIDLSDFANGVSGDPVP